MRCYNRCPDSALQAILDHKKEIKAKCEELGYFLTWFPIEEKWGACEIGTYRSVGELRSTIDAAYADCIADKIGLPE